MAKLPLAPLGLLLGIAMWTLGVMGAPSECIDCLKVEQADRKDYNWKFGDGTPTDPEDPAASEYIRSLERQASFWATVGAIGIIMVPVSIVRIVVLARRKSASAAQ